jgi:hypothetical protein
MKWGKLFGGGGRGGLGREGKQALLKTKENKLRKFCFASLLCFSSLTHTHLDVVIVFREAFHPSVPSSMHGWHHLIILYNVKSKKLL